ncbi:glycoside hydrolase family 2 protein [Jiangella aurantiaca]|uniref:beta-mannosidase n=1 Tax=Jiangella aurantiaca TaxID=2530373 RepID=A0A4R5AJD2_9ACTN|nr:glycoside hydrolase family 2 protein [Jiangella aurantiaca]TDD72681.1 glycoside hydrolase family 2 protein [Jiangella aurantiaca]
MVSASGTYRPLHDGWTLSPDGGPAVPPPVAAGPVPAIVPGCVHTDLLAAGLIPDPYLGDAEHRLGWIGRTAWTYRTSFDWSGTAADRADLVCDGLDTVATVTVNGVEVGRTANMHRGYRFDVSSLLVEGDNDLAVRFDSAYDYAEGLRDVLGDRPNAYPEPFQFIRKMACNFGWDWGPTLVTAGIWQPIGLHSWSTARLARVRPLVTVDGATGLVTTHVELERATSEPVTVSVAVGELARADVAVPAGERSVVAGLTVPGVARWWPRGYGEQPRYPLEVVLRDGAGRLLDSWSRSIGFRSVRLDTSPDADGSAFTVVVNDVPVFVRGVNWIPDDCFPARVGPERYRARLTQACEANVNTVRVWGGGRYESDAFYDLADELGLMVTQDFLFACAAYPEEEPLRGEVEAEAREQVIRLASHPSLVMWTGNNENLMGFHDWGWADQVNGRSWGSGYYFDVLPAVVAELDATRPYWPGSPYSGHPDRDPNDPGHGSTHIWDVWNTHDYTHYRSYRPRFVAEFGYQGPAAYATLRRAVGESGLAVDSPELAHRQKAVDGDAKLRRGLDAHLPAPRDFDDWHYLAQLNQARAVRTGIEHFRALRPHCMGTIVWQLNDCWPVTSWAAIDGDGRAKPMWYALREAYADRLLTVQPRDGALWLIAVNDARTAWQVDAVVARHTLDGTVQAKTLVSVRVAPGSARAVPLSPDVTTPAHPEAEFILAEAAGPTPDRAWWFFAEDRDVRYPEPQYHAAAEPHTDGVRVTVTAETLLRDLTFFPDRLDPDAVVDDALVTLLPGESARFTIRTAAPLDLDRLTSRPVLRCLNDLGVNR